MSITSRMLKELRTGPPLQMVKVDDHLWATNTYWMLRLPTDFRDAIQELLGRFNLEPEPGVYKVTELTIQRAHGVTYKPERIAELVREYAKPADHSVTPLTYGTHPLAYWDNVGCWLSVLARDDDTQVVVARRRLVLLESMLSSTITWTQGEKWHDPLLAHRDDELVAMLMPTRHTP